MIEHFTVVKIKCEYWGYHPKLIKMHEHKCLSDCQIIGAVVNKEKECEDEPIVSPTVDAYHLMMSVTI